MDINFLLETNKISRNPFSHVSTETFNVATLWIKYVTSRKCIPVEEMLVTIKLMMQFKHSVEC